MDTGPHAGPHAVIDREMCVKEALRWKYGLGNPELVEMEARVQKESLSTREMIAKSRAMLDEKIPGLGDDTGTSYAKSTGGWQPTARRLRFDSSATYSSNGNVIDEDDMEICSPTQKCMWNLNVR